MTREMDTVRERVRTCRSLRVLTGAGVSAESGVPTFRGKSGDVLTALFEYRHPRSS
jgi:NAD-dependent SIR2 family protein deacetylase